MKKRRILILKSDKNACLELVADVQNHMHTNGSIQCIEHGKYLSWLYCNNELGIVMLVDPPHVEKETVDMIEASGARYFFIVLTGCHRRKKDNLLIWTSLFPFTILTPQTTAKEILTPCERIIDNDKVYAISYAQGGKEFFIGHIIGSVLGWYRTILLHIPPYLFSGYIMQHHNSHYYRTSANMQSFIHYCAQDTIVLPELGGIHLLHT